MNNFLSIVWYKVLPPIFGGQRGIALFNQHLGERESLTCLCSSDNEASENLSYRLLNQLTTSRVQFWNPFVRREILDVIKGSSFSHVIIEHPYHGWLGRHKHRLGFKFIVHAHNIEHLRMKARNKPWWRQIRKIEEEAFGYADLIMFKTKEDLDAAVEIFRLDATKCMVLPFGITQHSQPIRDGERCSAFRKRMGIDPDERIILFAGSMDYEPNAAALEAIEKNIIPELRKIGQPFRIIVCGNKEETNSSNSELIMAGQVSEIEEFFLCSDVFINPVTMGSGVQTKNIEAVANGLPLVCTRFSAKGLPTALHDRMLLVSEDGNWKEFAENIMKAERSEVPQEFYRDLHWEGIISGFLRRLERIG